MGKCSTGCVVAQARDVRAVQTVRVRPKGVGRLWCRTSANLREHVGGQLVDASSLKQFHLVHDMIKWHIKWSDAHADEVVSILAACVHARTLPLPPLRRDAAMARAGRAVCWRWPAMCARLPCPRRRLFSACARSCSSTSTVSGGGQPALAPPVARRPARTGFVWWQRHSGKCWQVGCAGPRSRARASRSQARRRA